MPPRSKPSNAHATDEGLWRNRIVGEGLEAPDQLLANPHNWRVHPQHQQSALQEVLDRVGWVQRVIVNTTTGHVVDGHMRVAVAISRGETAVPVLYVQLSEEEERLVLATLDPLASLAATDRDMLADLVEDVALPTDGNLSKLLKSLAPASGPLQLAGGVTSGMLGGGLPGGGAGAGAGQGTGGAPVPGSIPDDPSAVPPSHVRMFHLYLDVHTHGEFRAQVQRLESAWGHDNPTDAVREAVRRAHAALD